METDFRLKQAILIYEDQVTKRNKFATVHPVNVSEANRSAVLGPGRLLTMKFLEGLYHGLQRPAKTVLLPQNVLAYSGDLLIWWTPPRLHPMFFSDGAEDRAAINGSVCPHPPLVWKVRRGHLALRALNTPQRPDAGTGLMVAPYWNTESTHGNVCEGSMARPRETEINGMTEWEEGFFNSQFTHPSGMGKLTSHPGGFMGLWTELAGADQFPGKYLVPCRQTLGEFVEEH
jgi:PRTRC genetic system protein B